MAFNRRENSFRTGESRDRANGRRNSSRGDFDEGPRGKPKEFSMEGGFGERRSKLKMYDATCDKCGKPCELPFKPTGSRPVYCRDCFNQTEDFNYKPERKTTKFEMSEEEFLTLNRKLDKIMKHLQIE